MMLNLPNSLSLFRMLLIPVFCILYLNAQRPEQFWWAGGVLLLSGVTDLLDGKLARRYHQVTSLGKLLDPLADKLTLIAVCVCLSIRRPLFWIVLGVLILKELIMLAGGICLLKKGKTVEGAKWFGKVATCVFYGVMLVVVAVPQLPWALSFGGVLLCCALMLLSFFLYLPVYRRLSESEPL